MTRLNVWNPCNRLVDEELNESRLEGHRARLELIRNSNAQNVAKPSSAGTQRRTTKASSKMLPKTKSPVTQAEMERGALKMIRNVVELQRGSGFISSGVHTGQKNGSGLGKRRSQRASAFTTRSLAEQNDSDYVPNVLIGLAPGGDLGVPIAVSHPLYTRHSATMTHHFEEQNDVALNFVPGKHYSTTAARQRKQVQLVQENRKMMQRVLFSKMTFSCAAWRADEQERRKVLKRMSRYSHLTQQHSPSSSTLSSPTARSVQMQDGRDFQSRPRARQWASQQTLVMVDHVGEKRLDLANVVRTGSPVTHLRQCPRPLSACAASAAHRGLGAGSDLSNSDQDTITEAMSQIGIVKDGDNGGSEKQGQRDAAEMKTQ